MPKCCPVLVLLSTFLVLGLGLPASAQTAAAPIDSTLFTTYNVFSGSTSVNWIVCGSTQGSSGCYGSGSLGPFGIIGAMIEGNPTTQSNVVTRFIYVLDMGTGTGGNGVTLNVYKKTDTITTSFDTVSVTLFKTVSLPLVGGSGAKSFMAANKGFLFIGTDQSSEAVEVQKGNLKVTPISVTSGINASSITADPYGYVTVTFGSSTGTSVFGVYAPNGGLTEDGGGTQFMLNTVNAVLPLTLP